MFKKEKSSQMANYKNDNKKNKGITLIALVVTIIVLVILAAVSINTLFGDNGLITKANDSVDEDAKGKARDKVSMEVLASFNNDGTLNPNKLKANIESHTEGKAELGSNNGLPVTVTLDGYTFQVEGKGEITGDGDTTTPEEFNPEEIEIGVAVHPENYGKEVNGYTKEGKWRLFYQDAKYTYIIHDELVPLDKPSLEDNYSTGDYGDGSKVSAIGRNLNPLLRDYGSYKFFESGNTYKNIRAVAWLTDAENVWNEKYLQEGSEALYAIGGPTLELFRASFNAAREHNEKETGETIQAIPEFSIGTYGYKGEAYTDEMINSLKSTYSQGIYRKDSSYTWWFLSSPYAGKEANIWDVDQTYRFFGHDIHGSTRNQITPTSLFQNNSF